MAFIFFQEKTAAPVTSSLGVDSFRPQIGLSQNQEHQRIGLLLFRPLSAHDGPRHATNLDFILGRPSPPNVRQHGCSWPFRSRHVHFWQHCAYPAAPLCRTSSAHLDIHE
jgi:hypothetical protein